MKAIRLFMGLEWYLKSGDITSLSIYWTFKSERISNVDRLIKSFNIVTKFKSSSIKQKYKKKINHSTQAFNSSFLFN